MRITHTVHLLYKARSVIFYEQTSLTYPDIVYIITTFCLFIASIITARDRQITSDGLHQN